MYETIRMIIARKVIERRFPLIATAMELHRVGFPIAEQEELAQQLISSGKILRGRTFNVCIIELTTITRIAERTLKLFFLGGI